MGKKLLINEISELLNIESSTLRYWEKCGLIHLQRDGESGYRYFDNHSLLEILEVSFYRRLQVPIKVIKKNLKSSVTEKKEDLTKTKQSLLSWQEDLEQTINKINIRLSNITEIEQMAENVTIPGKFPYKIIKKFDVYDKKDISSYLSNPEHFVFISNGEVYSEGLAVSSLQEGDHLLLEIEEQLSLTLAEIISIQSETNIQKNITETVTRLKKQHNKAESAFFVLGQYMAAGYEDNVDLDYYKCWFFFKSNTIY